MGQSQTRLARQVPGIRLTGFLVTWHCSMGKSYDLSCLNALGSTVKILVKFATIVQKPTSICCV